MLLSYKGFSQLSKKHFIPPLTSADSGSSRPQDQYIYLSTPRNTDVPYIIKPIGQPEANYIRGVVSNNNPVEVFLGNGRDTQLFIPSPSSSVISNNKGYIIESEDVIYVSIRMNAGGGFQAGALVSKGLSALDTVFRIGSYTNENPQDNYLNFVSIMATEDNTQVSFSNLPNGIIIQNYSGPTPVNITLNEGESYVLAINSNDTNINTDGLIGCLVNSNKPIVVNCGSANGSFSNGNARDYGIDQIVGLSKIGTEYIFVRGDGLDDWENVLLVAHTDNTTININGNATGISINTGEYFVIEGNNYSSNDNMYVETSQPVFAYQGVGGLESDGQPHEANQGMFFVPPLNCETRGNLDNIANINQIGGQPYEGGITIVTTTTANVTITSSIDGNINLGTANTVTGNPSYITYKVKGIRGNITVESDDELYCAYFNYSGAATSGSFYSGFPSPPEINFEAEFVTLGNCIPNVTLEAANPQVFDSFRWQSDEGFGFQDIPGQTQFNFRPTTPSTYRLVGIITCTGEELISAEIPINICPDDRDNDGIIDNIDIDNDNDGILNCTESRGDVTLDLSDTRPPILRFQDGETNNTIATNNITTNRNSTGNSSVRLTGTGNIISDIDQDTNAENNYSISFTENVNIKFTEDTSITHTNVDGEFFIIIITPLSKNVTLVDPDNRLLVDSNFDGIFESGVTMISGSEIRFRINPNPSGTRPYNFFANQVDGLSFVHLVENSNTTSSFTGNISLTCFKQDNDFDGIKDEFDLDSDNDGIPDFIENTGILTPLSGVDANNDGLDDVYDVNILPIDTDNDTVLDFYDLDSDNDGITDLIETGELGLLSDTDLNGIVDGPGFGTNGWIDVAETAPDSNIIGYSLNDFDSDGIYSYIDEDSDGDECTDVIEAGFSDGNVDTYLGDSTVIVDTVADASTGQGLVTNAVDGYTLPNADYLTFGSITISQQPINSELCEASTDSFTIVSPEAEYFQWEVSTNNGATWSIITDDATYSGSQTNELTITNIQTTFNNFQYRARLDKSGNNCGDVFSDTALLEVNSLPTANNPSSYEQCDDDSNDGQSFFNLTLEDIKTEINPNFMAENLVFTYFETETDANSNTNPITSPEAYQDALGFTPETVWIRVDNENGCYRVVPLTIEVSPSITALNNYNPQPLFQCDDGIDNRDGIAFFDMSSIQNDIENNIFNGVSVTTHFYETITDAELETNEIVDIANHENSNAPNVQTIWVRVKSSLSNVCLGLKELTNILNVEALPLANPVTFNRACDIDTTDAVLSFPFDTSELESDILNGQNPAEVTITYFTETGNPLLYSNGTQVISPIQGSFLTENQSIIVRVTNNNTQDPDGACFDETLINFTIDQQPAIANTISQQIECDGSAGDIDDDGLFPFSTTEFSSTILGNQTGMNVTYSYIDENGIPVTNSTSLPNPLISGNQTISVEVINPLNPNCFETTTIDLIVNPLPEFYLDEEILICGFPFEPVDIIPEQQNSGETFNYEWTFEDGSVVGNTLILQATNITQSGNYTLTLTNPNTLCSKALTITVKAVDAPTISIDNIEIEDFKENNSITITNPSSIGNSTYKFSLVNSDGSIVFPYQESPIFNDVLPGFYTLFAQDIEEVCNEVAIPISVIGYMKFFTPNNDSFNDNWKIIGINKDFQSNSRVLIFDRYGKLLKQIDNLQNGWDGTSRGQIMPTDDYWFQVSLEDGRQFSGHFTLKR